MQKNRVDAKKLAAIVDSLVQKVVRIASTVEEKVEMQQEAELERF